MVIHHQICNYIEKNATEFLSIMDMEIDKDSNSTGILETPQCYLQQKGMWNSGVWGTDVEMRAAVHLFQLDIYNYYLQGYLYNLYNPMNSHFQVFTGFYPENFLSHSGKINHLSCKK